MSNSRPRSVSVVVATRNVVAMIETCLLSVLEQTHPDVEIVVIDGGSIDGTIEVLQRYSSRIKWVSEGDLGVNEAHRKGVLNATGTWIYFLGADDYLASPTALERLFNACPDDLERFDILTAYALYEDGRLRRSDKPGLLRLIGSIHGQGALYHRRLFREKSFDPQLRIHYDYDFNLWAFTSGKQFYHTNILLAILGCGGLSDWPRWRNYVEDMHIRGRYVGGLPLFVSDIFCVARYVRKIVRCRLREISGYGMRSRAHPEPASIRQRRT